MITLGLLPRRLVDSRSSRCPSTGRAGGAGWNVPHKHCPVPATSRLNRGKIS
jgi:hypothetical protein